MFVPRTSRVSLGLALCSVVLWALPLSSAKGQSGYKDTLELVVGQTEVIAFPDVRRVAIGNGALADVKVLSDVGQVLLIAKSPGVTDLRIWLRNGKQERHLLRVMSQLPEDALEQVRTHLSDIEGVRVRMSGDRILVEGNSLREEDFQRVQQVTSQFPNAVNYVSQGGVTLRGMILLDVKVLEVKTNELKNIGINWSDVIDGPDFSYLGDFVTNDAFRGTGSPGAGGGGGLPLDAGAGNAFFGISSRISSVINLLVQNGTARLLAEPKLTCRSGGEAEFLAGGEVPIPITDQDGALNVTFKQYGIILRMQPVSDADGYISTQVEVEVSTVDPSVSVLGIPGFLTRRTDTEMNVRQGQTMVISGLLSSDASKDVDKVPGLGNIPVLGELFKSRNFRDSKSELVVLVTPNLVDPEHRINRAMVRRFNDLQETSNKSLRFNLKD